MKDFEGTLVGLDNQDTVIGARVRMTDGMTHTFWGDHRMMLNAFEGRKEGCAVIIHYKNEWEWTVEFPDEE